MSTSVVETSMIENNSALHVGREPKRISDSKILVIDDEQIVIDVVTTHLNDAGFWNVVGTCDSVEAVERMKRERADLILMDICMPDVSGNYLIQIARADPNLRKIPLMVITADDRVETQVRALRLGADEVLTKPVYPADLVLRVEQALTRARDGGEE